MRKQSFFRARSLFLAVISLLALSACGKPMEAPETVINKAKQAIVNISSGHVEGTATARGGDGTNDLKFDGAMQLTFDKKDSQKQKFDFHVALSGALKATEKSLSGELDLNFIGLEKEYYAKLNKLSTSDDSMKQLQPFVDQYKGKWLKISEDFIPENIRNMQTQDETVKLKRQQLEDLFVKTNLFDVTKEYGVEKLNGRSVYHYGLTPNMDGFKDYMAKAAIIDGRELTTQEIEDAVKVLNYIKDAELWIDVDDYYILKSLFRFSGEAINQNSNLEVELDVTGSDFNKSVTVQAPQGAEDFNPLNLMMLGAPAASNATTGGTAAPSTGTPSAAAPTTQTQTPPATTAPATGTTEKTGAAQ